MKNKLSEGGLSLSGLSHLSLVLTFFSGVGGLGGLAFSFGICPRDGRT